jgi:hypothetical protein
VAAHAADCYAPRTSNLGFVRTIPRRGIIVVRKTKREIVEMITVWAAIENMAARIAATAAEIDALRAEPGPRRTPNRRPKTLGLAAHVERCGDFLDSPIQAQNNTEGH